MNRRNIVIAIAAGALILFGGATALYLNRPATLPAPAADVAAPELAMPEAATPPATAAAPATTTTGAPTMTTSAAEAETPAPAPRWNVYVRQHSPFIGPADARVTIVEFFDPACEACRAFYPIVHEILRRHPQDVRVVLRYTPRHQGSEEAARIIETARRQNVFQPVLTSLFERQPQWAADGAPRTEVAWDVAAAAGLDVTAARAAMNSRRITAAITQDVADGRTLNVRGTPTFFVNERPLTALGPQQLYDLVLSELAATAPAAR